MVILKQIHTWDDLRPFGIDALTGEACGLAMRLLCDVTKEGGKLVERFLGGTVTIKPGSEWNGGTKDLPHVGSVLLPRSILKDLSAFVLVIYVGSTGGVAALKDGGVIAFEGPVSPWEEERIERYYRRSNDPGTGDRNQHAMSGRVE